MRRRSSLFVGSEAREATRIAIAKMSTNEQRNTSGAETMEYFNISGAGVIDGAKHRRRLHWTRYVLSLFPFLLAKTAHRVKRRDFRFTGRIVNLSRVVSRAHARLFLRVSAGKSPWRCAEQDVYMRSDVALTIVRGRLGSLCGFIIRSLKVYDVSWTSGDARGGKTRHRGDNDLASRSPRDSR